MKRYLLILIFFDLIYGQIDFSLEDINPSSETYEQFVGPSYFSDDFLIVGFSMKIEEAVEPGSVS